MEFKKPPLSISDQIDLLQKRGLTFEDVNLSKKVLANINYYRLSAYMIPFQLTNDPNHTFRSNTEFKSIINLYSFDSKLRNLLFFAIEKIEVAFRCRIIYPYTLKKGAFWFLDDSLYQKKEYCKVLLERLDNELTKTNEIFIKHYKTKYNNPKYPPAWMSLEIISFGVLSQLYRNLSLSEEKKQIAKDVGLHPFVLESWLRSLSYVRNLCAHHCRIWNRSLTIKPKIPLIINNWFPHKIHEDKNFLSFVIIKYLNHLLGIQDNLKYDLQSLFTEFPEVKFTSMGFYDNWQNNTYWD